MISKEKMIKLVNKINKQVMKADLIKEVWVNLSWNSKKESSIVVTFFYSDSNFSVYLYSWEEEATMKSFYNFIKFILKNIKKLYQEYIEKELYKEIEVFEDYLKIRSNKNVD